MKKETIRFTAVLAGIGAIVGVAIGYVVYVIAGPYHGVAFIEWFDIRSADAVLWAILGAAVAIGLHYVLNRKIP